MVKVEQVAAARLRQAMLKELSDARPGYRTNVFSLATRCRGQAPFEEAMNEIVALARDEQIILCCPLEGEIDVMTPVIPKLLRIGTDTADVAQRLYGVPERTEQDGALRREFRPLPGSGATGLTHRLTYDTNGVLAEDAVEEIAAASEKLD